jgi:hypothetical protein
MSTLLVLLSMAALCRRTWVWLLVLALVAILASTH